jgi:hypothetical protein
MPDQALSRKRRSRGRTARLAGRGRLARRRFLPARFPVPVSDVSVPLPEAGGENFNDGSVFFVQHPTESALNPAFPNGWPPPLVARR